ncbi:MAG: AAA family ATPase [Acidobacteriota bacterium]|nr:AAA family ATPase [Acidobacteriota bacterium]
MARCAACDQENPPEARFCFACGEPLAGEHVEEERRIVSVVFVDLVGFTSQAEQLDPEDVRALLEPYHRAVREELESFGGVVEKFIGDAVMAVFGAPTAFGDDAERAVRAALAVRDRVEGIRVAVNTGEALVTLGARPSHGEAMVAGDVVNTAARLQQAAPVDGVLVGEVTYRATRDAIEYADADELVARGKAEKVRAWIAVQANSDERDLSSTFVGREREIALLRDTWTRVTEQRMPHLVTVLGEAGLGKTRLAAEFMAVVEGLGGFTVRGRTLPYRESSAYGAFASQLKQLCGIYESDTTDAALAKLNAKVATMVEPSAAAEVAGHLAILIGLTPQASVADRETLFFSIRLFIEAVARDRPTLLVFEDLHWADASLLDLVELLAARLRDLPILLVALARPELLDTRPGWGGGLPAYSAVPLQPLSPEDARALAAERLAARSDRATELARTAAGNPLFIEQLAATVAETTNGAQRKLPTTILGLVAARLDALPPAERALVLDASVGGKVFWRGALERMGADPGALTDLLAALERRDLIRREATSAIEGDQQYMFTHVLIRDVAYDLLPRAGRRERHEHFALFLEESTAEVGEAGAALARHWRDAGDRERALRYFVAAAEQAERGWAKDRAMTFYREALSLAADGDLRRRLQQRLAVATQAYLHVDDAQILGLGP